MGLPQATDLFKVVVGATQGVAGTGTHYSVSWSDILAAAAASLLITDTELADSLAIYGTAAVQDVGYFADAAQGALADSAVQPAALAPYALSANVYTQTAADALLATKANASETYTETEVDGLLNAKANTADIYTQAQVDTALGSKANVADVYTKAEVDTEISNLINGAPGLLDTLDEIAAAMGDDPNFATTMTNSLALKAPLANPAFTGVPTGPTANPGTNNNQLATTAYVDAAAGASTLSGLTDVTITTIAANEILQWDGGGWINQTLAEAGIAAAGHTHAIGEITGFTDNSSNWNTAHGWGDHAAAGYLAAASYTAADVFAKVLTQDGAGSGLHADLLDNQEGSYYLDYNNFINTPAGGGSGDAVLADNEIVTGAWRFEGQATFDYGGSLPILFSRIGSSAGLGARWTNDAGYLEMFATPTGTNAGTFAFNGDITAKDSRFTRGDDTGVVYLGDGSAYLYYSGSAYYLNGADLYAGTANTVVLTAGNTPTYQAALSIVGGVNSSATNSSVSSLNDIVQSGFHQATGAGIHNGPTNDDWSWVIHHEYTGRNGYGFQLANPINTNALYLRNQNANTWGSWVQLLNNTDSATLNGDWTIGSGAIIAANNGISVGNMQKIRLGRSTSQYISFFGDATDNVMVGVSPSGNPKSKVSVGWSNDGGATLGGRYTFSGTSGSVWHTGNDSTLVQTNASRTIVDSARLTINPTNGFDFVNSAAGQINTLEINQETSGADAVITFHVSGDYAVQFGLDGGTNDLAVGGWSMGAVSHRIFHEGNAASLLYDVENTWGANQIIRTVSPTLYFRDTDHNSAMIHVNSNIFYVLRGGVDTTSWVTHDNGRWPMELGLDAASPYVHFAGVTRANGGFQIYTDAGTLMGELIASDTTWLRINQNVAKNIYTPRMLRVDGGMQVRDGSASSLSMFFVSDTNTGFFRNGADSLGFATAGVRRGYWDGTALYVNDLRQQSDRHLKKNFRPIPYGLAEVLQLKPTLYAWRRGGHDDIGFIAQDVEKVMPLFVDNGERSKGKKDPKSLNYSKMVAALTKAIQELEARVRELEAA